MATITDFEEWIGNMKSTDIEQIYFLYQSISGVTSMGGYKCSTKGGKIFVQADNHPQTLMLASGKAVKAFLDKLDHEYSGDFGWVGGAYEFERANTKDD